jgi:D-alanine-D-alanine ligase
MNVAFVYDAKERVFRDLERNDENRLTTELFSYSEANALVSCLERLGHSVEVVDGLNEFVLGIDRIRREVDFVFNESKGLWGAERKLFLPALCAVYQIPYLGSGPYAVTLARNKWHTKAIVAAENIVTPSATLIRSRRDIEKTPWCDFPAIVKPNFESSSIGISPSSVVCCLDEMVVTATKMLRKFPDGLLVEHYIDGDEIQVSLIGNIAPTPLPPIKLGLADPAAGCRQVVTSIDWQNSEVRFVPVNDQILVDELQAQAVVAFSALGLADYGRIDFRVDHQKRIFFIEAATHPHITANSSFAVAALEAQICLEKLLEMLIEIAVSRHSG